MIHVCYGLNDKQGTYSKYTGVSMLSMFENTKEKVTVHIFHDNTLTPENRNNFNEVAATYNQTLKFYNFDEICPEKIQYLRKKIPAYADSRFTIGAFYRLMIDKKFFDKNISKIIYLDSDTVVNLDIAELWNYNLTNYPIAAVPEIEATRGYMIKDKYILNAGIVEVENYLCSGVVVLNFDKIGDNFFYEGINWLTKNQKCDCPDQDILNNFFSRNYLKLPEKFNAFVNVCKNFDGNILFNKIYHYTGRGCLGTDLNIVQNKIFLENFIKTPWCNMNIFQAIYETTKESYNERRTFALNVSSVMSGKERAFFTFSPLAAAVKRFFNLKNDNDLIVVNENAPLDPLIKAMKKYKNKKIFFIMVDNYEAVKNILVQFGFEESKHFLDATMFVPNYDPQDYSFLVIERF